MADREAEREQVIREGKSDLLIACNMVRYNRAGCNQSAKTDIQGRDWR